MRCSVEGQLKFKYLGFFKCLSRPSSLPFDVDLKGKLNNKRYKTHYMKAHNIINILKKTKDLNLNHKKGKKKCWQTCAKDRNDT